jgi:hypothetical protein
VPETTYSRPHRSHAHGRSKPGIGDQEAGVTRTTTR